MDGPRRDPIDYGRHERGAATPAPKPPIEKLLLLYDHIAHRVPTELSTTARLIRGGQTGSIDIRLKAEIDEAILAAGGDHRHEAAKIQAALEILRERGLDPGFADLLLEIEQVGYWFVVRELAAGRRPVADRIAEALLDGARSPLPVQGLAASAKARPTAATVFALAGKLLANAGLPLELFAALDLREMSGKPYLEEALRGL